MYKASKNCCVLFLSSVRERLNGIIGVNLWPSFNTSMKVKNTMTTTTVWCLDCEEKNTASDPVQHKEKQK